MWILPLIFENVGSFVILIPWGTVNMKIERIQKENHLKKTKTVKFSFRFTHYLLQKIYVQETKG